MPHKHSHGPPHAPIPFFSKPLSFARADFFRCQNLSDILHRELGRVNVLGNDTTHGHTGCVNALSWTRDGKILLSGGDDTTVRTWRIDTSQIDQEYPFTCTSVTRTGHRANIFSAQMLPYSSRVVTAAGDGQVRVFDLRAALATNPSPPNSDNVETEYSARQSCISILRCHSHRVKRVVPEDSSDVFLSVGEDGAVRQHDLRTAHHCGTGSCPAPLVQMDFELSTLSLSPLTPHQLIVAGEASYGYLFDRRHLRRTIESGWGQVSGAGEGATTCVRRFGRKRPSSNEQIRRSQHITGARISVTNGHEILLSYSGDGVYLFSTRDETATDNGFLSPPVSMLPENEEADQLGNPVAQLEDSFLNNYLSPTQHSGIYTRVPSILPRARFLGARNVATIKDVNFLGPNDEWVVSGSDDGNFFIWEKATASLRGIYEGDSSVVNMVEGHPHFPLVAVSGIDTTVKLFAPNHEPTGSPFCRTADAENITRSNQRPSGSRVVRLNLEALIMEAGRVMDNEGTAVPECNSQ